MKKRYCDFCNNEIDYSNPAAVFDSDTIFHGKRVIVRVETREHSAALDAARGGAARPDVCGECRNGIVAQILGLTLKTPEAGRGDNND